MNWLVVLDYTDIIVMSLEFWPVRATLQKRVTVTVCEFIIDHY